MRFAYIDSQGNEVSIPSVDALALRIELGAIGPDTELYDAQADRWGPAQTHEIFHTLSRGLTEGSGFVAPPPPVAPPPTAPPAPPPVEARAPEPPAEEVADVFALAPEAPAPAEEPPAFDFSMPLSLEGQEEEPAAPPAPSAPAGGDPFGLDLTFAPPPAAPKAPPAEEPPMDFSFPAEPPPAKAPPKKEEKKQEAPAFDFGGGLELAPEPFAAPDEPPAGAMDFSPGSGMEMETPMSGFTPDAPPAWMREEGPPAGAGGAMDLRRAPAEDEPPAPRKRPRSEEPGSPEAPEPREPRARPEPRNRPSPPKRTKKRNLTPVFAGVAGVAVLGAAGFFGWQWWQGRPQSAAPVEATPALPAVTIPDIPAELLPTMRDLGEAALGETIRELGATQAAMGLPVEPNRDWLAGIYLANASQYRDVQEFWEGIEAFVDRVREVDTQVFHDRYVVQLEAAGIAADTAAILLERADSGFLATREERFEAYALMDDLVIAALDLHDFLLRNEAAIEYDPAAGGVSRDPVLEAVPNTKELGDEMWTRVDAITKALDALGTLDRVTTERLSAVLFDRIRRAGFR